MKSMNWSAWLLTAAVALAMSPALCAEEHEDVTAKQFIQKTDKVVGLTDDQKQKMADIFAALNKAIEDYRMQNADAISAAMHEMSEAGQPGKPTKDMDKAQKDFKDVINAPSWELMKKSQVDLMNVLTPVQSTKYVQVQVVELGQKAVEPAHLAGEQIEQLKKAFANLTPEERGDLCSPFQLPPPYGMKMWFNISRKAHELLTDEQKAQVTEAFAVQYVLMYSFGGVVKFSDDQAKQLHAAYDTLAKDKTLKATELAAKLLPKAEALLTPEQKDTLAKANKQHAKNMIRGLFSAVEFSYYQNQKIEAACDELAKDTFSISGYWSKLPPKVVALLTDDQKAAVAYVNKGTAISFVETWYEAAKLSNDQMKQINAACDEIGKRQPYFNLYWTALAEKIDGLLTAGQKDAVKKTHPEHLWWTAPNAAAGARGPGGQMGVQGDGHQMQWFYFQAISEPPGAYLTIPLPAEPWQ